MHEISCLGLSCFLFWKLVTAILAAWFSWYSAGLVNRKIAKPWFDFRYGSVSLYSWKIIIFEFRI